MLKITTGEPLTCLTSTIFSKKFRIQVKVPAQNASNCDKISIPLKLQIAMQLSLTRKMAPLRMNRPKTLTRCSPQFKTLAMEFVLSGKEFKMRTIESAQKTMAMKKMNMKKKLNLKKFRCYPR